jgi:predicted MFS family arabinose efflux permease
VSEQVNDVRSILPGAQLPRLSGPMTGRSGKVHRTHYKWRILGIGIGAQAAFSTAFQGIPTVGSILQNSYHFSLSQVGIVVGAITCGIAVTDVFWGMLSDRIGERRVLITGLSGITVALASVTAFLVPSHSAAPAYWALAAAMFCAGALGGSINGASGRAVMGWFPVSQRGFAISLRVTAVPLGGALGAAVLPPLALADGFRWAFGFLTAISLLSLLAVALWLDEAPLRRTRESRGQAAGTTPSLLRCWDIWRVAITAFLLNLPQFTILIFGMTFLHTVHRISIGSIAVLLMIMQILGALSRASGGWWTSRRGGRHRRTLLKAYSWLIAMGFAAISASQPDPSWVVCGLVLISGSLAFGWHGVHYAEITGIAGANRSGAALDLENTMAFGGASITALLVPQLLSISSWPTVMLVIGTLPALLSVLFMPREPKAAKPGMGPKEFGRGFLLKRPSLTR